MSEVGYEHTTTASGQMMLRSDTSVSVLNEPRQLGIRLQTLEHDPDGVLMSVEAWAGADVQFKLDREKARIVVDFLTAWLEVVAS